jgi:hypothetical protein
MGIGRRLAATASMSMAILLLSGTAAFAHDCFNPQKNAHAPTAGVHYVITSFDPFVIEQVGNAKGNGGFLALAPSATGARSLSTCTRWGAGTTRTEKLAVPEAERRTTCATARGSITSTVSSDRRATVTQEGRPARAALLVWP